MKPPRIYACYSESHRPLLEQHFLPSIPHGFDLVLRRTTQCCQTGVYNTPGWNVAMGNKVAMVLDALRTETSPFVLSDVDVRFYDLKPDELESLVPPPYSAAYQLDVPLASWAGQPKFCAGLAVMRPSTILIEVYENVRELLDTTSTEQEALYESLAKIPTQCATYLPPDRFWNLTHEPAPSALAVDHANWIVGIEDKLRHLDDTLKSR